MTSFLRSQHFEGTYDSLGGVQNLVDTQKEESGRRERALVIFSESLKSMQLGTFRRCQTAGNAMTKYTYMAGNSVVIAALMQSAA